MTCEILFRGKSIHGEWIYGYLNQHRGNIRYDCDCEPIADGCYYINDWQAKIDTGMYGRDYKVDPDTVGRFSGLTDRNGTKIFEGGYRACESTFVFLYRLRNVLVGRSTLCLQDEIRHALCDM